MDHPKTILHTIGLYMELRAKVHLADNVHDPDGTMAVQLSCLVVPTSISTEEPHHGGPTVHRLR